MTATEAIKGVTAEHHFDESRNQVYDPTERCIRTSKTDKPIRYDLELIRRENGSLEWVE